MPGSQQSYVRIVCSLETSTEVTEVLTNAGEPQLGVPNYGFIAWRYATGGVRRYGSPVTIRLAEQILASDQPQFEFDRLLIVPRRGVIINASLRRIQI